MMLNKIEMILRNECEISSADPLLVGISGGPDSMCLLHVLSQIRQPIYAMHINHHLRPEAEKEARVVDQFAKVLGIDLFTGEANVQSYAMDHSLSIEEAARTLRYQLLFKQANQLGVKAIAVGHHADDQVETILIHLLRGSGLAGLKGMDCRSLPNPWSRDIALVRPLLATFRSEILAYLREQGIEPVYDHSNLDTTYFRNRVRHELLPTLEGYNPSIRSVFLRMGQTIKDDYDLLQQITDDAWEAILIQQGKGFSTFSTTAFLRQSIAIQRSLLRKAISDFIPGLQDVGFECIERGRMLLSGELHGSQTDLLAGIRLIKENQQFWLAFWSTDLPGNEFPAIQSNMKKNLDIPSIQDLNDSWHLEVNVTDLVNSSNHQDDARLDPFEAWLDADRLTMPLYVRSRQPGDQMKPYGLDGHTTKVSDLMVNLKIPKRVRDTWPLVCSQDEIVWMPGYRISHSAQVKPETTRAIHLRLFRKGAA